MSWQYEFPPVNIDAFSESHLSAVIARGSPWLSIILPTFNGAAYIRDALESICAQGDQDVEVIIIDDGSTDDTLDIATSYSGRLQLRMTAGERRANWVAGTNDGLRLARAPFSCFLHQDDYWLPGRLGRMRSLMEAVPGCAMYLHSAQFRDEKRRHLGNWTCPLPVHRPLDGHFVNSRLIVQCFTAISTPIFRTQVAHRCGMLDPTLWYTADWDFWMRMAAAGTTAYTPEALSAFRVHSGSLTMTGSRSVARLQEQLEAVANRWLESGLSQSPDVRSRARLSIKFNVALAKANAGQGYGDLLAGVGVLLARGPGFWARFFRDTRLHQRVVARLRARLLGVL